MLSVQGHILFVFQLLQKFSLPQLLLLFLVVRLQGVRVRIQDQFSGDAVDDCHEPVHFRANMDPDQGRDIHGSGQNRRMGVGAAQLRHKSQQFGFVHLHRLTGSQVFGSQNHRLIAQILSVPAAMEDAHHPLGDVLHIGGAGLHVFIVHLGEHPGKIVAGGGHRVLCIDLLGFDDVFHGIVEVIVLQHHGMHLENGRIDLAHFLQRLLIQCLELFDGGFPGILIACQLRLRVGDASALHHLLLPGIE